VQEVIAQRQARRDLANQHMHIIQIQAYIRMWIARRKYLEIKKATKYVVSCTTDAADNPVQHSIHKATTPESPLSL
jgi:hypothetical protein